jgi:hypothetical protein
MLDRINILKYMYDAGFDMPFVEGKDINELKTLCDKARYLKKHIEGRECLQKAIMEEPELLDWIDSGNTDYLNNIAAYMQKYDDKLTNYPKDVVLAEYLEHLSMNHRYMYIRNFANREFSEAVLTNTMYFKFDMSEEEKDLLENVHRLSASIIRVADFERSSKLPFVKRLVSKMQESAVIHHLECDKLERLTEEEVRCLHKLVDYTGFIDCWIKCGLNGEDLTLLCASDVIDETIFSGPLHYASYLYNVDVSKLRLQAWQIGVVVYAITHRKNKFLNLVFESPVFDTIPTKSLLFDSSFYAGSVDIDDLTEQDLTIISTMTPEHAYFDGLSSFQEVVEMYKTAIAYPRLYKLLHKPDMDEFRLIKNHDLMADLWNASTENIADKLNEKSLSSWMSEDFKHIDGITPADAINLLINYKTLKDNLGNVKHAYMLPLFMHRPDLFADERLIDERLLCYDEWVELSKNLMFSRDITDKSRAFILMNGAYMTNTYLGSITERDAVKQLVRAELSGRYRELRYKDDCLHKELDVCVNDTWKDNTILTEGNFKAKELDDFFSILQIGKTPTDTCLKYNSGISVKSLLSFFDACKKVVHIESCGVVIARAIMRVTKIRQSIREFNYTFDTDDDASISLSVVLEAMYTRNISDEWKTACAELLLKLAKEKARKLGATVLLAETYDKILKTPVRRVVTNMYITSSRALYQYIGILGGDVYKEQERSYRKVTVVKEGGN